MAVHTGHAATIPSAKFRFTSADGLRVACARWGGRSPVRGVVQIAHGMGEHIGRYVGLIEVLISAGLIVYGNDYRGHGRTAPSVAHFGDFGEGGFADRAWLAGRARRLATGNVAISTPTWLSPVSFDCETCLSGLI